MSRPRLIGLLLVLGTLAVYLPAAQHGFSLYDDGDYVAENRVVQNGLTWAGIKWAFTTWHASNWHPLTWISHMADCQLFGLNAGMHHCVNLLFHAANAVLLFALLLRMTKAIWPGAFVAALFAWHPLHVESVAWIAERKDVLSTFFGLLTLLCYARFVEESKVQSPKSKKFYALALLMFALGLLAKPMLVTLPFVLLLLDCWPLQRFQISDFKLQIFLGLAFEKIPFFLLAAGSCIVTFLAQHNGGAVVSIEKVSFHYRLENTPFAYALYLWKMIWPAKLAVIYPLLTITTRALIISTAVLVLISAAAWVVRGRAPYLLVGWLWFLGTLVPVIGIVQVGSAALADRYTYFPLVGIFIAIAFSVRDLAARFQIPKIILTVTAVLILAACLILTHEQLDYWRDDESLFRHAIAVTKNNDVAHTNLGVALQKEGRNAEAMAEYRKALQIAPERVEIHNDLANLLDEAGKPDEALAEYQEALRLDPDATPAHNNLGVLLVELGRFDDAMKQYAESARLDPSDWHAPYLTGKALLQQGRDAEAIAFFRKAVSLNPEEFQMLTFVARVLASDENPQVRNGQTALEMASKANALTGGFQPAMLDALAMAYAELGQFDDAQKAAEDAVMLAKDYNMTNDVDIIRQRLELYKNRRPFRESFTNAPAKELPKN
jgi:tetratricopeptide (TPR) repeat protein